MIAELKLIAALLDYPTALTEEILGEVPAILSDCTLMDDEGKSQIEKFRAAVSGYSLLEWQQMYCDTFDVSPVTSLYLFEHVYGSSTKRGAAMSSLKEMYQDYGLEISNGELPDYLPCYLDFLSGLADMDAVMGYLGDIRAILASIRDALKRNHSPYEWLIEPLINLQLASNPIK